MNGQSYRLAQSLASRKHEIFALRGIILSGTPVRFRSSWTNGQNAESVGSVRTIMFSIISRRPSSVKESTEPHSLTQLALRHYCNGEFERAVHLLRGTISVSVGIRGDQQRGAAASYLLGASLERLGRHSEATLAYEVAMEAANGPLRWRIRKDLFRLERCGANG